MIEHDKLVRDRIPEIIAARSQRHETRILEPAERLGRLTAKLGEECEEFRLSGTVGELADVAEVLRSLVAELGVSWDRFEEIRTAKRDERGGFDAGILLVRAEG